MESIISPYESNSLAHCENIFSENLRKYAYWRTCIAWNCIGLPVQKYDSFLNNSGSADPANHVTFARFLIRPTKLALCISHL